MLSRVSGSKDYARIRTAFLYGSFLTTFPCIAASGRKLPLAAIIKGKTSRSLAKIRAHAASIVHSTQLYFSQSGKMTERVMLDWLAGPFTNAARGRPSCSSLWIVQIAHWTDSVQELAKTFDVELIQVPARMTPLCQPLDVRFNGPMKAKRQQIWREKKLNNPFYSDSWQAAVERTADDFIQSLNEPSDRCKNPRQPS